MELTTRLGQDRYFWMEPAAADQPAVVLLELEAPVAAREESYRRSPTNLVVVLDRSGSMSGDRLDHAKAALREIVQGLHPDDCFGLVLFDHDVDVVVPAAPVGDRARALAAIAAVEARGSTDLSSGLVEGLRQADGLERPEGVRVLLISDGHANAGVTDPETLATFTTRYRLEGGVTTSTLGMGLGYDETVLGAIAQAGTGSELFAHEADTALGLIRQECGDLVAERYLKCRVTIELGTTMQAVDVINGVAATTLPNGVRLDLGGLRDGDARALVMRFTPSTVSRPGRRKVARVHVEWVSADDLETHRTSTSICAHVDRTGASTPVVDRDVLAELLFQRVQRRKRRVAEKLAAGDVDGARRSLKRIVRLIERELAQVARARRPEIEAELVDVQRQIDVIDLGNLEDRAFASKALYASTAGLNRRRDRRL